MGNAWKFEYSNGAMVVFGSQNNIINLLKRWMTCEGYMVQFINWRKGNGWPRCK